MAPRQAQLTVHPLRDEGAGDVWGSQGLSRSEGFKSLGFRVQGFGLSSCRGSGSGSPQGVPSLRAAGLGEIEGPLGIGRIGLCAYLNSIPSLSLSLSRSLARSADVYRFSVHVYVYTYRSKKKCVCVYIYVNKYTYIYIYIYIYTYMCMCMVSQTFRPSTEPLALGEPRVMTLREPDLKKKWDLSDLVFSVLGKARLRFRFQGSGFWEQRG